MTTAASAEFGRSASRSLKNTSSNTTTPAPTIPVSWVFAPDCSATAVRELLDETAKPWKKPAARLAVPTPIISWFGFTCSPRRELNEVDRAIVSVSDTSTMPTAATSNGQTSFTSVHGTSGVGRPSGSPPTVLRSKSKSAVSSVAPTTATSTAGILRVMRGRTSSTARVASPMTRAVELRWSKFVAELTHLLHERVGVSREPAELRELSYDDRDGEAVHVADLHLAGQQVRDETQLADPEPDLDQTHEHSQHARKCDRLRRVVAGDHQRSDGGEDQWSE